MEVSFYSTERFVLLTKSQTLNQMETWETEPKQNTRRQMGVPTQSDFADILVLSTKIACQM